MATEERVQEVEVNHVAFNPTTLSLTFSPLQNICSEYERGGWSLVRVVPVHQYESIAVFERAG